MAARRPQLAAAEPMRAGGPEFVHLHVHSEFSLLDGLARIPDMVERVASLGMSALAITDHGSMYGVIDFYSAAKARGIKPILGCEVYVSPRGMAQREPKIDDRNYHLTLLARDDEGYHNLLKIVSRAHLDGFYYKPRADRELLEKHSRGLICLSGCMSGEVARLLMDGQEAKAREVARWYAELFGKDSYYLEVQNQMLDGQEGLNRQIVAVARELDLPLVATNDSHYVNPEDSGAHDVLLCIQTNATRDQPNRMKLGTGEFFLRSGAEMARAFPGLEDALRNTVAVAEQVNLKLDFDRVLLPHFELPGSHTPESYLRHLSEEGLRTRYGSINLAQRERLDYELSVIDRTGYPLYFLIVADYVRWARERGIQAMPRGSVAGSLVIHGLGICDIDPLRFDLMFERFLHDERIGMPDIDMDFSDDRREEVIRYVQQKYGADRVAQIITFGTMAARAAVRDVGRALGMTYGEVDRIAKAIPMGSTIKEALEQSELKSIAQDDARIQELLTLAQSMEGIARNASTHAAGVVISRDPLDEHVPLQRATKGEEGIITQWPFTVIEKVGMLKMDFLGLANLTILDRACKIIDARHPEPKLDLQNLPIDYDEPTGQARRTYDMLGEGETTAVFQLESGGMRRCLKGLKPNQIFDLLAIVALYRPGPMDNIPAYTAAKNGQAPITYLHPDLEPILKETYGICVYQDQVLQIVRAIGGFSWGEADVLRKAMGKKIVSLMEEQREKFIGRVKERGYEKSFADALWAIIAPFAGYGFPKGHAAAYAVVAYQTAFLKANHTAEYMAAVLTSEAGNAIKVAEAVAECRRLGVEVLPPDVNRSGLDFTLEDRPDGAAAIRFGLSGVKNVGHGAIEMLLKARDASAQPGAQGGTPEGGSYADLADFCRRVDLRQLNRRAIESLIKAGAMGSLGERAALLAGLDSAISLGQQQQKAQQVGQTTLFDLFGAAESISSKAMLPAFVLPTVEPAERKTRLAWEKEMIGLYISEHPLSAVARSLSAAVSCQTTELTEEMSGQTVTVGGFISSMRLIPTKKGDLMAAVELEDLTGTVEVVVFPRTFLANRDLIKEDAVVLVTGKVDTRDDRPKILCESVALFAGDEDEPGAAPENDYRHTRPAQTSLQMGRVEGEAVESGGYTPPTMEARTIREPSAQPASVAAIVAHIDRASSDWGHFLSTGGPPPDVADEAAGAAGPVDVEDSFAGLALAPTTPPAVAPAVSLEALPHAVTTLVVPAAPSAFAAPAGPLPPDIHLGGETAESDTPSQASSTSRSSSVVEAVADDGDAVLANTRPAAGAPASHDLGIAAEPRYAQDARYTSEPRQGPQSSQASGQGASPDQGWPEVTSRSSNGSAGGNGRVLQFGEVEPHTETVTASADADSQFMGVAGGNGVSSVSGTNGVSGVSGTVVPAGSETWPEAAGSVAKEPPARPPSPVRAGGRETRVLLDLTMERSTRDERDVNRLLRMSELFDRHPGHDRVVVRFIINGRPGPIIGLSDRIRVDEELLHQVVAEFGEEMVRLRVPPGGALPPGAAISSAAQSAVVMAGAEAWRGAEALEPVGTD